MHIKAKTAKKKCKKLMKTEGKIKTDTYTHTT